MSVEEYLCIIPAKGTSTRFKKKNIADLCGRPLISYSIEAAKKSGLFKNVYVSTENEEIKRISESLGAVVPYIRPYELSKDPAGVVDVCLHMIEFLEGEGKHFRTLFILYPTSPLRTESDIISAFEIFKASNTKVLMSVSEFEHTPFASLKVDDRGLLSPYFPEYIGLKSQEMPRAYRANGAIIILDIQEFKKQRKYYFFPVSAYIMPWERSIDVDNYSDLIVAQSILNCR